MSMRAKLSPHRSERTLREIDIEIVRPLAGEPELTIIRRHPAGDVVVRAVEARVVDREVDRLAKGLRRIRADRAPDVEIAGAARTVGCEVHRAAVVRERGI